MTVATVDVSSRQDVHALVEAAKGLGQVTGLVHAAGVSPSQASVATILKVDLYGLYGTASVLEAFGNVIERDGSGVVIASQSGQGSALRAVRPPNRHITSDVRRDLVYAASTTGSL